jgi:hypothetical protein
MKHIVIAFLVCLATTGCVQKTPASSSESLQPEPQVILERLNKQCADDPWRNQIDRLEAPRTSIEANGLISGEVSAFVSDCKERLAKHGVQVKWDSKKQQYEVEKTQQ